MKRLVFCSVIISIIFLVNNIFGQSVRTEQIIRLEKPSDKTKYVVLSAPADLDSVVEFKLPVNSGMPGKVLSSDTNGRNLWIDNPVPAGTIVQYAGRTAPAGWLLCDGSSISRTEFAKLYQAIDTLYGSVDGAHFNVPDLRMRFPIGSPVIDSLGRKGGDSTVTLSVDQLPTHNHDLIFRSTAASTFATIYGNPAYRALGIVFSSVSVATIYTSNGSSGTFYSLPGSINDKGLGQAHNNMPPYIVVNYIIKI